MRTVHNLTTAHEAASAALRLRDSGMALKHAVSLTASAYGFSPEQLYIAIAEME